MSLRPRYASDGRLLLPERLDVVTRTTYIGDSQELVGDLGQRDCDPFERTDDDLLLAESFARHAFDDTDAASWWAIRHGVLDVDRLFPDPWDAELDEIRPGRRRDVQEHAWDYRTQQHNVRWHLMALAKLSEHREAAEPPRPGWEPHEGWNPRWAQPVLRAARGGDVLWLGGSTRFEAWILSEMKSHATYRDYRPEGGPGKLRPPKVSERRFIEEWWPTAHAAWLEVRRIGQAELWVPEEAWDRTWKRYDADAPIDGRDPRGRLSSDWHGMLELQRRLIEPFVVRAAANEVGIQRDMAVSDPGSGAPTVRWERRLAIREARRWRSVLAPIYLQLMEALLRISEGQSGAAICKECGKPFLTLDARRSSFCNDRERFRYNQRQRRKRMAAPEGGEEEPEG